MQDHQVAATFPQSAEETSTLPETAATTTSKTTTTTTTTTKKKKKRKQQEEEEEKEEAKTKKSKRKTNAKTTILSFSHDDDDDDDHHDKEEEGHNGDDVSKKKKKKKKMAKGRFGGMGFGGGWNPERSGGDNHKWEEEEDAKVAHDKDPTMQEEEEEGRYSVAALQELKSQQEVLSRPHETTTTTAEEGSSEQENKTGAATKCPNDDKEDRSNPFLANAGDSMATDGTGTMLTDATGTVETDSKTVSLLDPRWMGASRDDVNDDDDKDEENQDWQDQITRRAGVFATTNNKDKQPGPSTTTGVAPADEALSRLHSCLSEACTSLQTARYSLQQQVQQRKVPDLEEAQVQQDQWQVELETAGQAFEYHQVLRLELVQWVGALEHVQHRLQQVSRNGLNDRGDSIWFLSQRAGWLEWQEDAREVLQQGRQSLNETAPQRVDEFGRSLDSLQQLAQTRRCMERRRNVQENQKDNNNASVMDPAFYSSSRQEEWRQQAQSLQEAANVPLVMTVDREDQEDDEEWTSMAALFALLEKWQGEYPTQYEECFAFLSLQHLARVLVERDYTRFLLECTCRELETLSSSTSMSTTTSINEQPFAWIQELQRQASPGPDSKDHDKDDKKKKTPNQQTAQSLLGILVQSCLLPKLLYDLLGVDPATRKKATTTPLYDPSGSATETMFVATLFDVCVEHAHDDDNDNDKTTKSRLSQAVYQHLQGFFQSQHEFGWQQQEQPVDPIGKKSPVSWQDAMDFVGRAQVQRWIRLIRNVVMHWNCRLEDQKQVALWTLDQVVTLGILPVLLHDNSDMVVQSVISLIQSAQWWNQEDLFLHTAPLRAAAQKYQIDVTT